VTVSDGPITSSPAYGKRAGPGAWGPSTTGVNCDGSQLTGVFLCATMLGGTHLALWASFEDSPVLGRSACQAWAY
jgi:hypothetical protein